MTAGLLALPDDLLFEILSDVGRADVWDLRCVALTCRRLGWLVYGDDETVWRAVHAASYDNPFAAAGFLQPRTAYPWRTTVIERTVVARWFGETALNNVHPKLFAMGQHQQDKGCRRPIPYWPRHFDWTPPPAMTEAEYRQAKHEARRWSPLVFRVLNGLWAPLVFRVLNGLQVDLPALKPQGQDLPNFEFLGAVLASDVFKILVAAAHPPRLELGDDGMERMPGPLLGLHSCAARVTALMAAPRRDVDLYQLYRFLPTRRNWRRPMGGRVDWQDCMRNSWHIMKGDYPDRQGTGLLHLPPRPAGDEVWDWADVRGEWLTSCFGRLVHARFPPAVLSPSMLSKLPHLLYRHEPVQREFPTSFYAVPASTRAHVDRAFSEVSSEEIDLWYQFPEDPGPRSGIPTLYFHGTPTDGRSSSFVYGMVCLTMDEPPELEWIFAVWHFGMGNDTDDDEDEGADGTAVKRPDFVMRGVQVNWLGLSDGVHGAYGPRSWGPRSLLYSSYPSVRWDDTLVTPGADDGVHAYGTAHFFKTPHVPDDEMEQHRDEVQRQREELAGEMDDPHELLHLLGCNGTYAPMSLFANWFLGIVDDSEWDKSELECCDGSSSESEIEDS